MNSFKQIDKSQLLGFDGSGHALWAVALADDMSRTDEDTGAAKPSGEAKPAGMDKVLGMLKHFGDDEPL